MSVSVCLCYSQLTMAQALVRWLRAQYVERDGVESLFIAGVFGMFGTLTRVPMKHLSLDTFML